jgi:hypothetical protein
MTDAALHLPDEQLLLYAAGEIEDDCCSNRVRAHLEFCDHCKGRLNQLQNGLNEFAQANPLAFHAELPSAAGPRALLKAQLANSSARENFQRKSSTGLTFAGWCRGIVLASLMFAILMLASRAWHRTQNAQSSVLAMLPIEPIAQFTPGAVVAITKRQVCSDSIEIPAVIPAELKTRVRELYGIANGQEDAYEVDYLITPELGGATDIRNLWPQPYEHTVWNAHVKDQLESRLQQLVCQGNLDLATAQHDISTDWIAAYRKYFHVDAPIASGSS